MAQVSELVLDCGNLAREIRDMSRVLENNVLGEPMNEKESVGAIQEASRMGGLKQELERMKYDLEITQRRLNAILNECDPDRSPARMEPVEDRFVGAPRGY